MGSHIIRSLPISSLWHIQKGMLPVATIQLLPKDEWPPRFNIVIRIRDIYRWTTVVLLHFNVEATNCTIHTPILTIHPFL